MLLSSAALTNKAKISEATSTEMCFPLTLYVLDALVVVLHGESIQGFGVKEWAFSGHAFLTAKKETMADSTWHSKPGAELWHMSDHILLTKASHVIKPNLFEIEKIILSQGGTHILMNGFSWIHSQCSMESHGRSLSWI